VLTDTTYSNATSRLERDTYIGINATVASLDAINPLVTSLDDVPGYRLSINYTPDVPT